MATAGRPDEKAAIARDEMEAVLEVRRELGPSYDAALVDSFADRIESVVAERVDVRLHHERAADRHRVGDKQRQLALGIVSLGMSIPITIPLALTDHLSAVLVAWLGIAGVNAAHAAAVNGPARRRHESRRNG